MDPTLKSRFTEEQFIRTHKNINCKIQKSHFKKRLIFTTGNHVYPFFNNIEAKSNVETLFFTSPAYHTHSQILTLSPLLHYS